MCNVNTPLENKSGPLLEMGGVFLRFPASDLVLPLIQGWLDPDSPSSCSFTSVAATDFIRHKTQEITLSFNGML